MMKIQFLKNNPMLGKHSVTKFEIPNAGVHCTDSLTGYFVTECLFIEETWPQGYKTFSMLNSAEHEIYHAHKLLAF